MPEGVGYPNESEQERKQRIKKLKARTSKMRLAVINKKKKKSSENKYNSKDRDDYPAGDDGYVDFMDQLDVD